MAAMQKTQLLLKDVECFLNLRSGGYHWNAISFFNLLLTVGTVKVE